MQTKDTISHYSSHGEVVKGVGEVLPYVGVAVFSKAFIIEPVTFSRMIEYKSDW